MFRTIAAFTTFWLVCTPYMHAVPEAVSVKLWLDTAADSSCEQGTTPSGTWMIRNGERRDVLVVVQRTMEKNGTVREDQVRDTLGPQETRELGCEVSEDGRQTLKLLKASF